MSDLIDRQAAIDALKTDMASLDHIIQGMSANDVRLDAYVSQRNQVNCDIDTLNNLPTAQPEQLGTNLAEVGTDTISRQAAVDGLNDAVHEHNITDFDAVATILALPPVTPKQPDLSEAYANAVFTWLMSYQIQSAQLKGRYTPYEVIGWVLNDWRKEHDAERDT